MYQQDHIFLPMGSLTRGPLGHPGRSIMKSNREVTFHNTSHNCAASLLNLTAVQWTNWVVMQYCSDLVLQ